MRGMGSYQLQKIDEKEQKIFRYIQKHQPITRADIRKNGHFKTNSLPKYLKILLEKELIVEIYRYLVVNTPTKTILKKIQNSPKMIRREIKKFFRLILDIVAAIKKLKKNEPLRFNQLVRKCNFKKNQFKKTFEEIKIATAELRKIQFDLGSGKKSKQNMAIKKFGYVMRKKWFAVIQFLLKIVENLETHREYYPRFEYPRFKDIDNKYGIHNKFLNGKGQINYKKLEFKYKQKMLKQL